MDTVDRKKVIDEVAQAMLTCVGQRVLLVCAWSELDCYRDFYRSMPSLLQPQIITVADLRKIERNSNLLNHIVVKTRTASIVPTPEQEIEFQLIFDYVSTKETSATWVAIDEDEVGAISVFLMAKPRRWRFHVVSWANAEVLNNRVVPDRNHILVVYTEKAALLPRPPGVAGLHYGCYNKVRPFKGQTYRAQSGFKADGTPQHVAIPHVMSTTCQYDKRTIDNRCAGCKHIGAIP